MGTDDINEYIMTVTTIKKQNTYFTKVSQMQ